MKRFFPPWMSCVLGAAVWLTSHANASTVYNLSTDFDKAHNPSGVWGFGWKSTVTGAFTLFDVPFQDSLGGVPIDTWSHGPETAEVEHNGTTSTASYSDGSSSHIFLPGTVVFGPGHQTNPDKYCVIRFTAPTAGQYIFEIGIQSGWTGPISGDADFHIVKNGSEIYSEFLPPNAATTFSNRISLVSGDVVDFVGGPGADGNEFASNLKFASQITFVDGTTNGPPPPPPQSYELAGGFSTNANPSGAWSFGWRNTLAGSFNIFPRFTRHDEGGGGYFDIWSKSNGGYGAVYKNNSPVTKDYGPGVGVFPPGTVWFYPGQEGAADNYSIIRFTVPGGQGGQYNLGVAVQSTASAGTGDTDFHVLKNGQELFGRSLAVNSSASYSNGIALVGGDTVDFAIGRGQDNLLVGSGLKIQASLALSSGVTNPPPPQTNSCTPAAAGLVAWWRGEGNANDVTGAHNGVAVGGVTYTGGKGGQAFNFNGTDARIVISNSPSLGFA